MMDRSYPVFDALRRLAEREEEQRERRSFPGMAPVEEERPSHPPTLFEAPLR